MRAGIQPGDRVALLMENIPEWAVADYAALSIGAVTVPLYRSHRPRDIAYVLQDAGVRMVVASGGRTAVHLLQAADSCPALETIYIMERVAEEATKSGKLHSFAELETGEADMAAVEERLEKIGRGTLATLIYTSGTTGNPKGVMLSHGNILANLEAVLDIFAFDSDDRMLSFLPLAHSLERMASHFLPYTSGISVAFAERPDTMIKNMVEAKPTILVTVPRWLHLVRSRILRQIVQQPALEQRLFRSFITLGAQAGKGRLAWPLALLHRVLDRLVGKKIRNRFGGRMKLMVSGGAPLGTEVAEFFEAVGLPVLEGYGMTEAAPLISINPVKDRRIGTVGKAVNNVEVKIAGDGEILVRGPNVMAGYWKRRKATSETVVKGWLHTGDIGEMDADGYLRITDRKKDMIVNSGGENIAPQRIESLLMADDMIEQAVVYGDRKPYLVAIVVPAEKACSAWAHDKHLPEMDWEHLAMSDMLRKTLQARIGRHLKELARHEQIRRICICPRPFTIREGLLTPTLKIRRREVHEQFRSQLEGLYS